MKLLIHRIGIIDRLTSYGFDAIMTDKLTSEAFPYIEEFAIEEVSEPDRRLIEVGAYFEFKSAIRIDEKTTARCRASWLEFAGSDLKWND